MSSELSQETDTQQQSAISSTETKVILKEIDTVVDKFSIDRLNSDVLLNKKKKTYWVEKAAPGNCFMVSIKDFTITWGNDPRYWCWPSVNETSDMEVVVAELLDVCWLDDVGKFEMGKLTPGIIYEVVFVVMMKDYSYGWKVPVNIRLTLPDKNTQEHKENLMEKPRSKWFEISAGEFIVDSKKGGCVEFAIYEYEGGSWKRGLVVKGAATRPKL